MAWTASAIFYQAMLNPLGRGSAAVTGFPTTYGGLTFDAVNVALFNNTTAPDRTVAVASTGYNTGVWTTGNEVTSTSGNWAAGGITAAGNAWTIDTASFSTVFHLTNTAGAGNVTISAAFGCLVYDNTITAGTVAKQGMCFNYFGGSQSVTAGTFTIIWATVGATTGVFNIVLGAGP
jgi:hypothetical protein